MFNKVWYFIDHGMSITGALTGDMLGIMEEILNDSSISEVMAECQRKHIRPMAAADICGLAEDMAAEESY